jgi:tetratricopeptide (TPR) repeat protein
MAEKPFFRRVADQMLDGDTARQVEEKRAEVAAHPDWAEGHYHLAQLLRVQHKRDAAKLELLRALELKPGMADAHAALGEIYLAEGDADRAREHAQLAARFGNSRLLDQFTRHNAK